ncbi:MAG: hypothetical protein AAFP87_21160 [Pseudomonadota bacterium]
MNATSSAVCYNCCARKTLEQSCCTLFVDYDTISFEEVVEIFDNWLEKSHMSFVKLDTVVKFFKEVHDREDYFIELSKIPFISKQKPFAYNTTFVKNSNLQFFEMLLSEECFSQEEDIQFLIDSIAHVISKNSISEFKISSMCKLFAMLGNYLLGCELHHKHGLIISVNDVC